MLSFLEFLGVFEGVFEGVFGISGGFRRVYLGSFWIFFGNF